MRKIFVTFLTIVLCLTQSVLVNAQSNKYKEYEEPRLSADQKGVLQALKKKCVDSNEGFEELIAIGYACMFLTLAGHLSLQEKAEYYLEKAFTKDTTDMDLNRTLGRFYNIRMVDLDFSKTDMQVRVYGAMLGNKTIDKMTDMEFVSWSFFQMGRAIEYQEKKKMFKALGTVRALEGGIRYRISKDPENVEFHALGGNFAFFLAGNIPFGKKGRIDAGIKYFEYVREHWDEMRPGASITKHCPNTYKNFMFELADAYLIVGEKEKAITLYTELEKITEPRTRPKEIISEACKERMRNADLYKGDKKLMPPWPSDKGNCIVCHSYKADIPMGSYYGKELLDLSKIPSKAIDKPISLDPFDEPLDSQE